MLFFVKCSFPTKCDKKSNPINCYFFNECENVNIVALRNENIPLYYRQNPSMHKLVQLLQNIDNISLGLKVRRFLKLCKTV